MYAAVAFDLDGTLLDTEALSIAAGLEEAMRLGLPIDERRMHSLVGLDEAACRVRIAGWLGSADAAGSAMSAMFGAMQRREAQGIPLKVGVGEMLGRVAMLGLSMAVVTSSSRERARHKLVSTGLEQNFKSLTTVDDVASAKPAPDPYLRAAHQLGVAPHELLVFEDSETGVESALAAGATVVQVPDILPAQGRAHFTAWTLLEGAAAAGLFA